MLLKVLKNFSAPSGPSGVRSPNQQRLDSAFGPVRKQL